MNGFNPTATATGDEVAEPSTRAVIAMEGGALTFDVEGGTVVGPDVVMLDADDDLSSATAWSGPGYVVAPFLGGEAHALLVDWITTSLTDALGRGIESVPTPFSLDRYHEFVSEAEHQSVVAALFQGGIPVGELPVDVGEIEDRASQICGVAVTTRCPGLEAQVVCVRIVRPGSASDHNPPHRDVWLDHLRNALNGYVPLAGSTSRSALALVPGSHRWPESDIERTVEGARIGGIAYDVPAVISSRRDLLLVRPNPAPDEILLFSPYLIHGAGTNLEPSTTRVSLELRFWRR